MALIDDIAAARTAYQAKQDELTAAFKIPGGLPGQDNGVLRLRNELNVLQVNLFALEAKLKPNG